MKRIVCKTKAGNGEKAAAMAQMRNLDRELESGENFRWGTDQVLMGIFLFAVCAIIIIPAQMVPGRFEFCPVAAGLLILCSAGFRLKRYVYIKEEDKVRQIYHLLRFLPLDKRVIFRVRARYAIRFGFRAGCAFLSLQLVGALLYGEFSVWNVLYPALAAGEMCLAGILYAVPWKAAGEQLLHGWRRGKKRSHSAVG